MTTRPTAVSHATPPLTFAAFQRLIHDRYYPTDSARGTPVVMAAEAILMVARGAEAAVEYLEERAC